MHPRSILAAAIGAFLIWCRGGAIFASPPAPVLFRDVVQRAGIVFTLENSPTPQKHLIETMAGGLAAFDYDGDGQIDIFLTNGAQVSSLRKSMPQQSNRLFRNLGNWRFQDVTTAAGLAGDGYSIGASAADFDNDGHTDLFVAGVHSNRLYRNLGNGSFQDVTAHAKIASTAWSIAGGWFDFDNDGLLDLLVVNYVQWSPEAEPSCADPVTGTKAYCHPRFFTGTANTLYKNLGAGVFRDISVESGLARHIGKGMSVAFADYNQDGWMDVFVPNDKLPNFLFRNNGNGAFEETGLAAGVALLDNGKEVSGMGADFRDYDNDGRPDIVVAALAGETYPLFRNIGRGAFVAWTGQSQLASLTNQRSGWSPHLADFDNDGRRDLFVANSHVNDTVGFFESAQYKLPNSLFLSRPGGTFVDVSAQAGAEFQIPRAHRGAVIADFNGDGKLDAAVTSLRGPLELWANAGAAANHWLCLQLTGTRSNRSAIGATITLDGQFETITVNSGYASGTNSCAHFGLGARTSVDRIQIRWPSGTRQTLSNVKANQKLQVSEPDPRP